MADIDDTPDEQDQSEAFDEDNFDALEGGAETNEFRTFEDLPEVEDVTRSAGDDDEDADPDPDPLFDENADIDDELGLEGVEGDADERFDAGEERLAAEGDDDEAAAEDEVELVYDGLLENARGAQASAAHWEAKSLSDDDIDDLGYGPDEKPEEPA